MRTPGRGGTTIRIRGSRWARALLGLPILSLLLVAWGTPAAAAQSPSLTLTVSRVWNQGSGAGTWTPYTLTIRNAGPGALDGTVSLVADTGFSQGLPTTFPEYRAALALPAGAQRALTVTAMEPANGYRAEVRDAQGRLLATARPPSSGGGGPAVAIITDAAGAVQRVDAVLRATTRLSAAVSSLAGGPAFPTAVIRLSGLNAIVLDESDGGALGQDQRRALLDFVGLGGTLIEAGGAGARRTLNGMPAELLPLAPAGVATASLAAVGELGGVATADTAEVVTGDVAPWARVAVAADDGRPLVIEGSYGAGSIVQLTFDPLAPPFDRSLELAGAAWGEALSRGLSGVLGTGSSDLDRAVFSGVGAPGAGQSGSGPGAASGFLGYLAQVVADAPAAGSPPFGLLAVLLAAYVVVVSGLAYVVLKAAGRRGLLWVAVPTVAIVCTAAAYAVGFGGRGSDYRLVQVQVQRLAPGGVIETAAFDTVLSPRRGDVSVTAPSGALVTTAVPFMGPFPGGGDRPPLITLATPVQVSFDNVAVWDGRPVETLQVTHAARAAGPAMPIEVSVGIRNGRLVGQVVNHTESAVGDLQLVSPSGQQAALTARLGPGQTATIDAPVTSGAPGIPLGKGVGGPIVAIPGSGPTPPRDGAQALVALAASVVAVRPGEWALVGTVAPVETLRVGDERPARTGRAMITEPVRLQSADSATAGAGPARLVSTYGSSSGGVVEVFEEDIPTGVAGGLTLGIGVAAGPTQPVVASVEVYDWDRHTWRAASRTAGGLPATALTPGETRGGVVRARVSSSAPNVVAIAVTDAR